MGQNRSGATPADVSAANRPTQTQIKAPAKTIKPAIHMISSPLSIYLSIYLSIDPCLVALIMA